MATNKIGKQTIIFSNKPSIISAYSTVGEKEGKGPLSEWFDNILVDNKAGEKTWERAECKMLEDTIIGAIEKGEKIVDDIDIMFSGDLVNQIMSSSYVARDIGIPFMGLYGACSTMTESLLLASSFVNADYVNNAICSASSHFCTAERQFRMPLEHGNQRTPTSQWTVTGAGAMLVSGEDDKYPRITGGTCGKVLDFGVTDSNMMGAAMAPAAIDTLEVHFKDTGLDPSFYDLILSGDLGYIGKSIVIDTMRRKGYDISGNYNDCGAIMFDDSQDVHGGGSGCGCSASIFSGLLYKKLLKKSFKNVLIMSTGALLSTISSQQGESIPGIAHAVALTTEG